jgi:hypothetical protein
VLVFTAVVGACSRREIDIVAHNLQQEVVKALPSLIRSQRRDKLFPVELCDIHYAG